MKSRILFAANCVFSALIIALTAFPLDLKAAVYQNLLNPSAPTNISNSINIEADERRVFELVNSEREKNGLNRIEWNPALAQLARNYSEQMADEKFFSHFDKNGASVQDRAEFMKIRGWSKIGENLFVCSGTSKFTALAVQKWMKSPSHKQNILDAEWTTSGIGVAESSDGEIYITQVFMRN